MDTTAATFVQDQRASTGVHGLDDVLGGGLTPFRLYLVEGTPGEIKGNAAVQEAYLGGIMAA